MARCHLGHGQERAGIAASLDRDDDVPRDGMTYWLEKSEAERELAG
jgi:hypothetical protein